MSTTRTTRILSGAAAVTLASMAVAPAVAMAESPAWATVTGYAPAAGNNQVTDFCTTGGYKIDNPGGHQWTIIDNPDIPGVPTKVVVKAGSDASTDFANTIFEDGEVPFHSSDGPPTALEAGQTVWADTNGDGVFNPGGQDGDKEISHIIVCEGGGGTEGGGGGTEGGGGGTEGGIVDSEEDTDEGATDGELAHTGGSLVAAILGGSLLAAGSGLTVAARRKTSA